MSVNSRMKEVDIYELTEQTSKSGAKKQEWNKIKTILASIYQANQFASVDNYRNVETTHQALTHYKGLIAGKYRVIQGDKKYEVLSIDNNHRLTVIILKEINLW
ncbi:phage head completion protein [Helcococcus bovis]|uniref:phage head completion protein n=1 Tax=Helcococcus bovis TaxID=3153252 RepID=UPI0038B6EAD1